MDHAMTKNRAEGETTCTVTVEATPNSSDKSDERLRSEEDRLLLDKLFAIDPELSIHRGLSEDAEDDEGNTTQLFSRSEMERGQRHNLAPWPPFVRLRDGLIHKERGPMKRRPRGIKYRKNKKRSFYDVNERSQSESSSQPNMTSIGSHK